MADIEAVSPSCILWQIFSSDFGFIQNFELSKILLFLWIAHPRASYELSPCQGTKPRPTFLCTPFIMGGDNPQSSKQSRGARHKFKEFSRSSPRRQTPSVEQAIGSSSSATVSIATPQIGTFFWSAIAAGYGAQRMIQIIYQQDCLNQLRSVTLLVLPQVSMSV